MKKTILSIVAFMAVLALTIPASAHMLWVNLYESFTHPPGHAIASIGWGHTVPQDDLPGSLKLASYEMIDPDRTRTALPLPDVSQGGDFGSGSGILISGGDPGARKLTLSGEEKPGTYQVVLASSDNFYSVYLNEKGRKKWAQKAMDEVRDATKVLAGMKYKSYAKAFFTVGGEWSRPEPVGYDLELLPLTDLSGVRAGDVVRFEVSLMGKPLSTSPEKSLEYITAHSNAFGGPDGFFLASMLHNGKGQFRMPAAGQWVVNVYTSMDVDPEGPYRDLAGKCTKVFYSGSISFQVKP